jgi:hypothetical protein
MRQVHAGHHVNSQETLRDAAEAIHEFRAGRATFSALIVALISPITSDHDLPDHDLAEFVSDRN